MSGPLSPAGEGGLAWMGRSLKVPLRSWLWPLIAAAVLVTTLLSFAIPLLPPIFARPLALAVMITLWVYALRVACRLLLGRAQGAALEREYRDVVLPHLQALRQIGLWLMVSVLLGALFQWLSWFGLVFGLAGAVIGLPGMTSLVALDNKLASVFKPARWQEINETLNSAAYRRLSSLLVASILVYIGLDALLTLILPGALRNGLMMGAWIYLLWA
ncbi:MAG: hypothetical protein AAGJ52_05770, partial [Pseudomonadota bacterium]